MQYRMRRLVRTLGRHERAVTDSFPARVRPRRYASRYPALEATVLKMRDRRGEVTVPSVAPITSMRGSGEEPRYAPLQGHLTAVVR